MPDATSTIPLTPTLEAGEANKVAMRAALLTAPILPTMLRLAFPTVAVLIAQTGVGIAETFYVSFLGTDALAGVSMVFPLLMLMAMMSNGGIGGGVASAVARAIGAGRFTDADALATHALILAVIFGLLFSVGVIGLGPSLYRSLGGDGASLHNALIYSLWIFGGAVPVWIVNLLAAALRGSGNVRVPAIVTLSGAALLLPLSPAFIFGFGPIPRMGVAGAGAAVTIYYSVAALVMLHYMMSGRGGLLLKRVPLQARLFKEILRVGIVSALSSIQPNLTVLVVTGVVGLFGIDALAGYGIASRLDYLLIPILFGLGTAVMTMVGTNFGAGNIERARRIAWTGVILGAAFAESIGLLVAVFPLAWLGWFSHDAKVLAAGALYLRTVGPVYGGVGVGMLFGFSAQGSGRPIWPFLGGFARMLIAAGLGWLVINLWGAGLSTLFLFVGAGIVSLAIVCTLASVTGAIWKPRGVSS
jgi:putative MATE family efflux protein